MIIALLVLTVLAVLFPKFLRMTALIILFIVAVAVIHPHRGTNDGSLAIADDAGTKTTDALDFSKQVYTKRYAIICSQAVLLTEPPEKIYATFTSIFSRAEKVAELGCAEYQDGVPVFARMMNPPFDDFVSVDFCDPKECSPQYFTMTPNLRN